MNPNNVNRFSSAAVGVDRKRSKFKRDSKVMTTFDSGFLIPLYWDEVIPGDNMSLKANGVCRMMTPKFPTIDNSYLDLYAFYVPNRLIWNEWQQFMGDTSENTENPFLPQQEYLLPQITFNRTTRVVNNPSCAFDVLSYLGVPPLPSNAGAGTVEVNALPIRAYCKIWNEWFRDENFQLPIVYEKGSNNVSYNPNPDFYQSAASGGTLAPVNKFKDYFTSALPSPQRGNAVTLPIGALAPVVPGDTNDGLYQYLLSNQGNSIRFFMQNYNSNGVNSTGAGNFSSNAHLFTNPQDGAGRTLSLGLLNNEAATSNGNNNRVNAIPANLYADLTQATAVTVNQMRLAFQTQKYLETLARGGCRYIETLYSLYGVKTSDARLQRSEYLGGERMPIQMMQVTQTSQTTSDGVLGDTAAFSLTSFIDKLGTHFMEEHGILMICGCVRTDQAYSQGISKQWIRKTRFDYYAPVFANLGEMPIYNKEIYLNASDNDDLPFGYQEAWAEYRYKPNLVTGLLNPSIANNLSAWTYVQKYNTLPTLNREFIKQSKENIAQTLAVQSVQGAQFILDLYIENTSIRVMPMYSVPGLIDHA